ncbi:MAG: type IV pilus modification PilV family protein [Desulfitobacteriaceae bacterium]
MRQGEKGMTLLEVVIAIAILMLGVGFIIKGDGAIQHYRAQTQLRQQMLFYAAGQLEILLHGGTLVQGNTLPADEAPLNSFAVTSVIQGMNAHLEQIQVTVTAPLTGQSTTLDTYRVK